MDSNHTAREGRTRRRDAQLRRDALIAAAATVFAQQGYGAPLEQIADRAGVGRATLYRNFPDRAALALAIFAREVDRLEAWIDPAQPMAATLATMVSQSAAAASVFARIAADLHAENPNAFDFHALGARLEHVVAPALAAAKQRGEIAADVTPRRIVLAIRMAAALIPPAMDEGAVAAQVSEALALLLDGLRPR